MKRLSVFLTWSGDRSLGVAQALHDWLPNVLQFADPWISVSDVDKGSKWQQSISGQLASASFGIICLTPENLASPWILFEAGALSKTVDSRVWTYLYDLGYTAVKDPLSQFQHTVAAKEDTRKLIASINAAYDEGALDEARVRASFEKWWPELDSKLTAIPPPSAAKPKVDDTQQIIEMTTEILTRVRELDKLTSLLSIQTTAGGEFDFDRLIAAIRRHREEAARLGYTDFDRDFSEAESIAVAGKQRASLGAPDEAKRFFGRALSVYKSAKHRVYQLGHESVHLPKRDDNS
jgi:hypothetical protein